MSGFPILTALTVIPLLGGCIVLGLEARQAKLARSIAWVVAGLVFVLAMGLVAQFDTNLGDLQFEERQDWIKALGVQYRLGVDGLGLLMVLLTAIVVPMAMAASVSIKERVPLYFGFVLLLQAGLLGTFTALNFFHWFLFWELSLIPAFFLIKLWGGPGRSRAAIQFFVYTMAGSIALLLGFVAMYLATGSFDFIELGKMARAGTLLPALATVLGNYGITANYAGLVVFCGVLAGFAVKTPMMPLHSWLPTTYAEAPTPVTMLLTGLMSKMGVYGFLRIVVPIFPESLGWSSTWLLWFAVATIVLSALAALAQTDLKRILAYSSINHLGYCLLGVFSASGQISSGSLAVERSAVISGVLLQVFNHGVTAAALFWFVALLEQRSGGRRSLSDFGGLRRRIPVFCGLMGIAIFSSLGLPGLNGFVGEFLVFKGAFAMAPWAAALSTLGLLLTAVFLLKLLQQVFFGPLNPRVEQFPELTWGERLQLVPVIALMFLIGIYPQAVLAITNRTVVNLVKAMGS